MNSTSMFATDLDQAASLLRDPKNRIVVLAGAGTSTSAGIPDFRSPGTGLYANLAAYDLPYPEAVFDLEYFEERPQPFYTLARDLWPGVNYPPTLTHSFYALLHAKKRLISVLTQNIDGLERAAGVPDHMLVEAHGSFATASCIACRHPADAELVKQHVLRGTVARCESDECIALVDGGEPGLVKPDIVFFGEGLPKKFFAHWDDVGQADVVLVLGTSLVVDPFGSLVYDAKPSATSILINRDLHPAGSKFRFKAKGGGRDLALLGSCDDIVRKLVQKVGWEQELDELHDANLRRHDARSKALPGQLSAAKAASTAAAEVGAVAGEKLDREGQVFTSPEAQTPDGVSQLVEGLEGLKIDQTTKPNDTSQDEVVNQLEENRNGKSDGKAVSHLHDKPNPESKGKPTSDGPQSATSTTGPSEEVGETKIHGQETRSTAPHSLASDPNPTNPGASRAQEHT